MVKPQALLDGRRISELHSCKLRSLH